MSRRFQTSLILVVVFCLGLAAGVGGMIWAWPGVRSRFVHKPQHEPPMARMQRTLSLTPQQVTEMSTVLKGVGDLRHQIHLKYAPEYERLCDQSAQTLQRERDEYVQSPERQKALDQIHGILSDAQWKIFQDRMVESGKSRQPPDPCHRKQSGQAPSAGAQHR